MDLEYFYKNPCTGQEKFCYFYLFKPILSNFGFYFGKIWIYFWKNIKNPSQHLGNLGNLGNLLSLNSLRKCLSEVHLPRYNLRKLQSEVHLARYYCKKLNINFSDDQKKGHQFFANPRYTFARYNLRKCQSHLFEIVFKVLKNFSRFRFHFSMFLLPKAPVFKVFYGNFTTFSRF